MKSVHLRLEAEIELFEAALWYETEKEGLGDEFGAEVHRALESIADGPRRFPLIVRDIRRALVDRLPYGVFFVEFDDELSVIGIIQRVDPLCERKSWGLNSYAAT